MGFRDPSDEVVEFADQCVTAVERVATDADYDATRIFSGAGHDATHMADLMNTEMVFAVSDGGKSHTEAEHTSWADCRAAVTMCVNAACDLATSNP